MQPMPCCPVDQLHFFPLHDLHGTLTFNLWPKHVACAHITIIKDCVSNVIWFQVPIPIITIPTVAIPAATTPTNVTLFLQLQAYCNVKVSVRSSQRCSLFLFLTLSLTLTSTLYFAIGSVEIGTAPMWSNYSRSWVLRVRENEQTEIKVISITATKVLYCREQQRLKAVMV